MKTTIQRIGIAFVLVLAAASAVLFAIGVREDAGSPAHIGAGNMDELVSRGAYLARAGDCMACHTTRGGAPYAGGRAIRTPFGSLHSPNITPDPETGIGSWSADDFWRALHNGKSKDGSLLYPAFPYPNYTRITRADADAMYAYFRTVAPVRQESKEAELRFPFNLRPLLAFWRALYFRPGEFSPDTNRDAEWNRGAYLVQGPGHCNACHTPRNAFGATQEKLDLSGAMIPMLDWYASSLTGGSEAGLGDWDEQHLADLLKTGISARGAVSGPMAEVVRESLQHLDESDIRAMVTYLKSLPRSTVPGPDETQPANDPTNEKTLKHGAALYEKHCVDCHKASGAGEPPHYPALAGNRALMLASPVNAIRAVLHGGYPPSTEGNPRPYGMPPFAAILSDEEAAAVVSYVRNAWGNHAPMVKAGQINRYRAVAVD